MDEMELRNINKAINDIWKLIKKYLPVADPDSDAYWMGLIRESGAIGKKYDNHPLVNKMILAFADYVEHEAKGV